MERVGMTFQVRERWGIGSSSLRPQAYTRELAGEEKEVLYRR